MWSLELFQQDDEDVDEEQDIEDDTEQSGTHVDQLNHEMVGRKCPTHLVAYGLPEDRVGHDRNGWKAPTDPCNEQHAPLLLKCVGKEAMKVITFAEHPGVDAEAKVLSDDRQNPAADCVLKFPINIDITDITDDAATIIIQLPEQAGVGFWDPWMICQRTVRGSG